MHGIARPRDKFLPQQQQEIRPWEIARNWELGKECVAEKTSQREKESNPERPIPAFLRLHAHRRNQDRAALFAVAKRQIQRYNTATIATKARPPMIFAAVPKPTPTSASGAATPENTTIAEITTPMTLSPTIRPDASSTPSCFAASGLRLRLACLSKNQPTTAPTTII